MTAQPQRTDDIDEHAMPYCTDLKLTIIGSMQGLHKNVVLSAETEAVLELEKKYHYTDEHVYGAKDLTEQANTFIQVFTATYAKKFIETLAKDIEEVAAEIATK